MAQEPKNEKNRGQKNEAYSQLNSEIAHGWRLNPGVRVDLLVCCYPNEFQNDLIHKTRESDQEQHLWARISAEMAKRKAQSNPSHHAKHHVKTVGGARPELFGH